jgi:hypothetical protein
MPYCRRLELRARGIPASRRDADRGRRVCTGRWDSRAVMTLVGAEFAVHLRHALSGSPDPSIKCKPDPARTWPSMTDTPGSFAESDAVPPLTRRDPRSPSTAGPNLEVIGLLLQHATRPRARGCRRADRARSRGRRQGRGGGTWASCCSTSAQVSPSGRAGAGCCASTGRGAPSGGTCRAACSSSRCSSAHQAKKM